MLFVDSSKSLVEEIYACLNSTIAALKPIQQRTVTCLTPASKETKEKERHSSMLARIADVFIERIQHALLKKDYQAATKFEIHHDLRYVHSHVGSIHYHLKMSLGRSVFWDFVNTQLSDVLVELETILQKYQLPKDKLTVSIDKADTLSFPDDKALEKSRVEDQNLLHVNPQFRTLLLNTWVHAIQSGLRSKVIFISYAWPNKDEDEEIWSKELIMRLSWHLSLMGFEVYLDENFSGAGFLLSYFMQKIHGVDHVLVISSRTMARKLALEMSGVNYEYQQIKNCLSENPSLWQNRFVIPVLLNNSKYCHDDFAKLSEVNICKDGYLHSLMSLARPLYEFGPELFRDWWKSQLRFFAQQKLQEYYLTHPNFKIKRIFYNQLKVVDELYTDLTIVNRLANTKQNPAKKNKFDVTPAVKDENLPLSLSTLLQQGEILSTNMKQRKRILLLGKAGAGKGTACKFMLTQWALRKLWHKEFDWVFYINLPNLTSDYYKKLAKQKGNISLRDIIYYECLVPAGILPDSVNDYFYDLALSERTVLLVDGLNEAYLALRSDPDLTKALEMIISFQQIILTTRPYFLHGLDFENIFEIIGFSTENKREYINRFYHERKCRELISPLLKLLMSNSFVDELAQIPLNLELICSIFEQESHDFKQGDSLLLDTLTSTDLFNRIRQKFLERFLLKQGIAINTLMEYMIVEQCKPLLNFLEHLAYHAFLQNTLILTRKRINRLLSDFKLTQQQFAQLLDMGFIRSYQEGENETDKHYEFIHANLRDFFAAHYFMSSLMNTINKKRYEDAMQLITHEKYNPRFSLYWSFVSGLCSAHEKSDKPLSRFWNQLMATPLDIAGGGHRQLLLNCLEEMPEEKRIPNRAKLLTELQLWFHYRYPEPYIFKDRRSLLEFMRYERLVEDEQRKISRKKAVPEAIEMPATQVQPLVTQELEFLSDEQLTLSLDNALFDSQTRFNAKNQLKRLAQSGKKEIIEKIISKQMQALTSKNANDRYRAVWILGLLGLSAASEQVCSALQIAATDISPIIDFQTKTVWTVAETAIWALGEMREKAANQNTYDVLNRMVHVPNPDIRYQTVWALSKIYNKAITTLLIDIYLHVIIDKNNAYDLKCLAISNLFNLSADELNEKIITILLSHLGQPNLEFNRSLITLLEKAEVETKRIIDAIKQGSQKNEQRLLLLSTILNNRAECQTLEQSIMLISIFNLMKYYIQYPDELIASAIAYNALTNHTVCITFDDKNITVQNEKQTMLFNLLDKNKSLVIKNLLEQFSQLSKQFKLSENIIQQYLTGNTTKPEVEHDNDVNSNEQLPIARSRL